MYICAARACLAGTQGSQNTVLDLLALLLQMVGSHQGGAGN